MKLYLVKFSDGWYIYEARGALMLAGCGFS